jgi:hypothetical protein
MSPPHLRCGRDGFCDQLAYNIGHLGPFPHPILNPFSLEIDACRICARIVGSNYLDRASIAGPLFIYDDNSVIRLFARAYARQADH